jgi:hypothetical protein
VKEAECSGNIMYVCMKMGKRDMLKPFQEWEGGNKGE